MSAWPDTLRTGPLREWPGTLSTQRRPAPFSAGLTDTLRILDREIYNLVDTRAQQDSAELLIAIPAGAFRRDGKPYANARAEHPGVIFSLDSRHGHLSYPCDTFTTWQDNLRAIALALEALRKVDRYGVTRHGEQYRGFLELEATAVPASFSSWSAAHEWLADTYGYEYRAGDHEQARGLLRLGQRKSHPDLGGDTELFQRVSLAEAKLREAGLL
ncbi:molecular chaperone DnaJ [Leucobacter massiliensis]|uniref:Molecular chaperone DnaJ n=1 Tax=Leucobacter massiliensis TaxID=1686285 RepID=A0A2S9QMZ2_9MICO|nr:molecular chaperone DnaJ [Leucobacter massiliensis]PRI10937.1 hypothetical protein B4915_08620 [Leucobacter massiliensis]